MKELEGHRTRENRVTQLSKHEVYKKGKIKKIDGDSVERIAFL